MCDKTDHREDDVDGQADRLTKESVAVAQNCITTFGSSSTNLSVLIAISTTTSHDLRCTKTGLLNVLRVVHNSLSLTDSCVKMAVWNRVFLIRSGLRKVHVQHSNGNATKFSPRPSVD